MFTLKNYWDCKGRREGCQSPAKSSEDYGMNLRIGRPNKSISGVARNASAKCIRDNGGPGATRRMTSSNDVLDDVANTAPEGTGDGK